MEKMIALFIILRLILFIILTLSLRYLRVFSFHILAGRPETDKDPKLFWGFRSRAGVPYVILLLPTVLFLEKQII